MEIRDSGFGIRDSDENRGFEDLIVWQASQDLAVHVYTTTNKFPDSERFGITNQIRRAVSSISANIAEGYGRSTAKDRLQFMAIAYGSLLETKNFIYLSRRLNFIDEQESEMILGKCVRCQQLLNGYKRSLRK